MELENGEPGPWVGFNWLTILVEKGKPIEFPVNWFAYKKDETANFITYKRNFTNSWGHFVGSMMDCKKKLTEYVRLMISICTLIKVILQEHKMACIIIVISTSSKLVVLGLGYHQIPSHPLEIFPTVSSQILYYTTNHSISGVCNALRTSWMHRL